jgi:hypothetical protein
VFIDKNILNVLLCHLIYQIFSYVELTFLRGGDNLLAMEVQNSGDKCFPFEMTSTAKYMYLITRSYTLIMTVHVCRNHKIRKT